MKRIISRKLWWGLGGVFLVSTTVYFAFFKNKETNNHSATDNSEAEKNEVVIESRARLNNEKNSPVENSSFYKIDKGSSKEISVMSDPVSSNHLSTESDSVIANFKNFIPTDGRQIQDKSNPCTYSIEIQGKTIETCELKAEGVLILSINGGVAPYHCGLRKSGFDKVNWMPKGVTEFRNLGSGNYQVLVEDNHGCASYHEKIFFIGEKKCTSNEVQEHAFKPENSEQFSLAPEKEGHIIIYNRSGKPIFQSEVHADRTFTWDGKAENGKAAEKGMYLYQIQFKDGTSKKGYITVH